MSWLKAKDWASGVEYSSLFHSGLRCISLRPRSRRARTDSSSSSVREKSSSGGTCSSMASSMASLPSRLLRQSMTKKSRTNRTPTTSSESSPARAHKATRPRPSSMFVRPTKEMAWSSGESFFEIEGYHWQKIPERDRHRTRTYVVPSSVEMDSARSHSGLRSFFVNLGEFDRSSIPPKEESFLSLSSSPDAFLHHPIPRRERPVSMQTMPLPSRRSSVHHRTRESREREPVNRAWMLEESSPELKAYESGDDEDVLDLTLDRDSADWRQFHVDWLQNEPTIQLARF